VPNEYPRQPSFPKHSLIYVPSVEGDTPVKNNIEKLLGLYILNFGFSLSGHEMINYSELKTGEAFSEFNLLLIHY
jgi:hypothetical protein